MKKRIFNNLILKIISVVLAFIVWLILVNVSDPTTAVTVSGVNVRFENESLLADKGYTYEVLDGEKISVDVSGPKSEVTSIGASDIDAYVDLGKLSSFSDYADIIVNVSKDGNRAKGVTVTPKTSSVKLSIGNRSNKEFNIIPQAEGEADDDRIVADEEITPASVRIAGPSDAVSAVDSVKAVCDVSGKSGDISEDVAIRLFDEEGEEIIDPDIEMSRAVVRYTASLYKTKTVKLKYELGGSPEEGSEITDIDVSEEEVTISGSDEVLEKIDAFEIPSSALDISGLSYSKTFKIWLPDFAPDGVEVQSENSLRVTVYIDE